jgi:hypothetical protein
MYSFHPDKWMTMIKTMADVHKDQMFSMYFVVEKIEYRHPSLDKPVDQLVPMLIIDYK